MVKLTYLTLFPELIESYFREGLLSRAQANKLLLKNIIQLRDFAKTKHKSVDGKSYGGGDGMVFSPEPIGEAIAQARKNINSNEKSTVILLSPQGRVCDQSMLSDLSKLDHLVFVCGRYAGFDQRISKLCDQEISIGDFVLSGGELPALVLTEGLMRHKNGFLGNSKSVAFDSFADDQIKLLEAPQFTEPILFNGDSVPEVLVSGHHKKIEVWKFNLSLLVTLKKRPDLLFGQIKLLSLQKITELKKFYNEMSDKDQETLRIDNLGSAIDDLISTLVQNE
jgi:tRNA (guanine37-N1)-methyltransferase